MYSQSHLALGLFALLWWKYPEDGDMAVLCFLQRARLFEGAEASSCR